MNNTRKILHKALEGHRIDREEVLALYTKADFFALAQTANQLRSRIHPEKIVTYVVDRNINYSNICICACKFCAFYRPPGDPEGYVLSKETLAKKIQETIALGGNQILLQGSHHPDLDLDFYLNMLNYIKETFPQIHIHGFSPPEIVHLSNNTRIPIKEILSQLIAAGLDSIPGGGAEILVDRVRNLVSPNKCRAREWLEVMAIAHELGLKTTATMMFGHVETLEERITHLFALRDLQDQTSGFTAFIPWTFQPDNTPLQVRKTTSVEYLRLLALSRIVLDNFANLQVSWVTMGAEIAQLALFYGANDFGSTMIEENVVAASGVSFRLSEEQIKSLIQEAGFVPRRRNQDYTLRQ